MFVDVTMTAEGLEGYNPAGLFGVMVMVTST